MLVLEDLGWQVTFTGKAAYGEKVQLQQPEKAESHCVVPPFFCCGGGSGSFLPPSCYSLLFRPDTPPIPV